MYESVNSIATIDRMARLAGLLAWMRRGCKGGITILMYHKVLPEYFAKQYTLRNLVVEDKLFDSQMAWLSANFNVLTVSDAMKCMAQDGIKRQSNAKPIACVTFDDGYEDNYKYAAPILEAHGLRATFYVTTGFIKGEFLWFDRAALAWRHDVGRVMHKTRKFSPEFHEALTDAVDINVWLSVLKKLPVEVREKILDDVIVPTADEREIFSPLTPEKIGKMAGFGHEIGSHSVTHPILTNVDDEALKRELEESRQSLRTWSGQSVDGICYPNGNHDARVINVARSTGYQYGITVNRGMVRANSNVMALPRRAIFSSSRQGLVAEAYQAEIVGYHDWLRKLRINFRKYYA